MRVKPTICVIVMISSILVFYYFTLRDEIMREYETSTKINIEGNPNYRPKKPTESNKPSAWLKLKTKINYTKQDKALQTLNDKIINSKKFNSFLYNFLDKSATAKNVILSQGESFSVDFNSSIFLSTLYYTKYESENHFLVTKGKEKKNAVILQIAIQKALVKFYESPENSLLAAPKINEVFNSIQMFEKKSDELKQRIYEGKGYSHSIDQISKNSELKILEKELENLVSNLKKISESEKEESFQQSLEIPYLKNYGKIREYNLLLQQVNKLILEKKSKSISEEVKRNKSQLSLLLKKEYDNCIENLKQQILETKIRISSLKEKILALTAHKKDKKDNTPDTRLLDRITTSLNQLKADYFKNLTFWNNNKSHISFDSENFENFEN